jgi:hypothetical protein
MSTPYIAIRTTDADARVFISKFDGGTVFVNVSIKHGTAHVVLTKEQAKELIDALQEVIA